MAARALSLSKKTYRVINSVPSALASRIINDSSLAVSMTRMADGKGDVLDFEAYDAEVRAARGLIPQPVPEYQKATRADCQLSSSSSLQARNGRELYALEPKEDLVAAPNVARAASALSDSASSPSMPRSGLATRNERAVQKPTATRSTERKSVTSQTAVSPERAVDDGRKKEVAQLQVLAMRARVALNQPKLPCWDSTTNRLIAKAKEDPAFAGVLNHVAGGAGNILPNQEPLQKLKDYIAAAQYSHGPQAYRQSTNAHRSTNTNPAFALLSQEEWPLRLHPAYLRLQQEDARRGSSNQQAIFGNRPKVKYLDHPDAGIDMGWRDHHDVAYPISLLPKATWDTLHHSKPFGAYCSRCRKPREITPHQRKLFLTGERLSWPPVTFGVKAKTRIEEALWPVNFGLGIEEPVLLSTQPTILGGNKSRKDRWYPFKSAVEAQMVMWVLEQADALTENSWAAWKTLAHEQSRQAKQPKEGNRVDDEMMTAGATSAALPKSGAEVEPTTATRSSPPPSQDKPAPNEEPPPSSLTLVDMYRALDQIERTSQMSSRFLEAYAEKLHAEICKNCWFELHVLNNDKDESGDAP